MKCKKLIIALLFIWGMFPLATIGDIHLYNQPVARGMVTYYPQTIGGAFLKQNLIEVFAVSLGLIFCYILYRKEIGD